VFYDFLRNVIPALLEDVNLLTRVLLRFMRVGAPPHFHIAVREFLNNVFLGQWVGRGGPTAWLPRSSRFLGTSNTGVNSTEVDDVQSLQHWTQNGFELICTTP